MQILNHESDESHEWGGDTGKKITEKKMEEEENAEGEKDRGEKNGQYGNWGADLLRSLPFIFLSSLIFLSNSSPVILIRAIRVIRGFLSSSCLEASFRDFL